MLSLSEPWEMEMSRAKGKRRASGELSSRQGEWLAHLKRCEASGETMKAYAKRHELSVQAMYQAVKDLRRRGALPSSARSRANGPASFVRVSAPPSATTAWRVRFASGAMLEGAGTLSNESLTALIEALSASR
jgi:hypothetical protein